MGGHNLHYELFQSDKIIKDPGDGGTIHVDKDLQMCEMTSVGADETRDLDNPTRAGIRCVLRMLTDGGDIVVTAANGWNVDLETDATFADAGDLLSLISVSLTATTFRWQVLDGQIGVGIATSTATATATATATPSSTATTTTSASVSKSTSGSATTTQTATDTATQTISVTGTDTASTTASVSKSTSGTATTTQTATDTATRTATQTVTATATASSTSTATATATATGTQ